MEPHIVCTAHPADTFGDATAALLSGASGAPVVCVNPRGPSLEAMVDEIEAVRRARGIGRWVFWGMSGGGFLGQIYAARHPDALAALVIESACACFRRRVADAACLLSPFHPRWRGPLERAGLLPDEPFVDADPGATEWIDIDGVGAVFRRVRGPALLVSPVAVGPAMRAVMNALWGFDARTLLPSIHTPTVVICGAADPVLPLAHARAVHDAIMGSEFVAIEGAGHVPVTEKRPEVAEAVRRLLARI